MGICKSKLPFYNQVAKPSTAKDQKIQRIYGPMVEVDHKDNVNKKYSYLLDIKNNLFTNQGVFKTNQYDSKVTKEEMEKQINEFWGIIKKKPESMGIKIAGMHSDWHASVMMMVGNAYFVDFSKLLF